MNMNKEIRVGTWNALNAFGDESLSTERLHGALEVVKRMDADVLAVQEMALHGAHQPSLINERLEEVTACMAEQGYAGITTGYSPFEDERNAHFMSLWTRIGGINEQSIRTYGRRHGLRATLPGLAIHGVHFDDQFEERRVVAARDLLLDSDVAILADTIALGDFNAMHTRDPRSKLPRLLGKVGLSDIEVGDYYDRSKKVRRLAGKAIRICRMANGSTLALLESGGFHDADPTHQPTIGSGRIAFQIDHILGSAGVIFENFTVHPRSARPDGKPLSDHSPISALTKR